MQCNVMYYNITALTPSVYVSNEHLHKVYDIKILLADADVYN